MGPHCSKNPFAGTRPARLPRAVHPRAHRPRWDSSTSPAFRVARALAVAGALLLVLGSAWLGSPTPEASDAGTAPTALAAPETPSVLADAANLGPDVLASLPVPPRPPEWQETRCDPERREVAINGGCYKEQAGRPPCAKGEFDHAGKCWAAVAKRSRPLQSIQE